MDPQEVIRCAERRFAKELFDAAVKRQVEALRARKNQSLWQRLIDKLPFTITRRAK